jgi:CBS domain-containing protein
MHVYDICTHQVISVSPAASVTEAARLMRKRHVGMLVAVEQPDGERIPVGVLTDRDIVVEVVAPEVPFAQLRVDKVMTREPVTCSHDEQLLDAVARMRTHGVRRLPVLNDKGGPVRPAKPGRHLWRAGHLPAGDEPCFGPWTGA